MHKCDKVYVPDPDGKYELIETGSGYVDSLSLFLAPANATIVISIEELSELWNAAYRAARADLSMETKLPALDFEAYLKSKGITV